VQQTQSSKQALTLFEKIWAPHVVMEREDGASLLYVDRHLVQDGSAPAFEMLHQRQLKARVPSRAFGTPDHYIPTLGRDLNSIQDPEKRAMARALEDDCEKHKIPYFGLSDARQGIVHVIAPEQGLSQPGQLIVCGDSHTATHGAFGALAFGIGASEVAHVLATQTLWQRQPLTMRINIEGTLGKGVSAKDIILAIIGKIGAAGAVGHVIEYTGETIRKLSMQERMTVCNMSIEAGGRAGMVAPDEKTIEWLKDKPFAPKGAEWDAALLRWRELFSDSGAVYNQVVEMRAEEISPMVTWGNSPEDVLPIDGTVPYAVNCDNSVKRKSIENATSYMGLTPGQKLTDIQIDHVFIGSCTNGRIEDLRSAAAVVKDRQVAKGVQAWVVPGSGLVKREAEKEGLDQVFLNAGFQWREPGCSMCLGTNGDQVPAGQRCASTSNRNFVGRQGPGSRTHLMSPAMAAAAAVTGRLTDVRNLI
jgi:3-isopropylmalate/(R)-2-methylmalate dehydratase large subunit